VSSHPALAVPSPNNLLSLSLFNFKLRCTYSIVLSLIHPNFHRFFNHCHTEDASFRETQEPRLTPVAKKKGGWAADIESDNIGVDWIG
jgi:hypothetical protein